MNQIYYDIKDSIHVASGHNILKAYECTVLGVSYGHLMVNNVVLSDEMDCVA